MRTSLLLLLLPLLFLAAPSSAKETSASWTEKAAAFAAAGQTDQARAACDQALRLNPRNSEALALRAVLWVKAEDWANGRKDWDAFIRLKPAEPKGYAGRGRCLFEQRVY
ncbi:MAG: tetratricopeptide repeat protein, partial [Elusimicrobiota bacterium]